MRKFLIAPTFVAGKNYLRQSDRNPNEWMILVGQMDDWAKMQGLTEAEIEYIPSSAYANHRYLNELLDVIAQRKLTVKEVNY